MNTILKKVTAVILGVFVVVSIAFAFLKETQSAKWDEADPDAMGKNMPTTGADPGNTDDSVVPEVLASADLQPDRIQVFYFHRSFRCIGCINVEAAAYEAVSIDHSEDVQAGKLEWHSINCDDPQHSHYVTEYDLYTQELIFVEMRNAVPVRNEKIPEVWQHWENKSKARAVVGKNIDMWLGGLSK